MNISSYSNLYKLLYHQVTMNALQNTNQAIQNTGNKIGQGLSSATNQIKQGLSKFGNPTEVMSDSKEFLTSNTLVAKISITLLVFILFVFFLFLGLNILGYWNQGTANPYVVPGMIYGSNSLSVPGTKIQRSNNQEFGMEYTWSFWMQISDIPGKSIQYQYGQIDLTISGKSFEATNTVRLKDEYLYGVSEVSSAWPRESLRAQAIAARTYALNKGINLRPTLVEITKSSRFFACK